MKKIQEAVTFIKASREEAITLANDIVGDAEVHALYIQKGFIVSPQPVGFMVVPLAKEWVSLTNDEIDSCFEEHGWSPDDCYYLVIKDIEAKLRKKNT